MSDRVTITMSDGTTREVDESTPVESPEGIITVAHYAEVHAQPVTAIYEPTREYWTPYEPWMRDVLAGDARVSWVEGGIESRGTWLPFASAPDIYPDEDHAEFEMRIHPDDTPERPTERRVNVTITDVYAVPDEHGFLRINVGPETAVIDQDATNVTVTDVPERPAEEHPDEELSYHDGYHDGVSVAESVARKAEADREPFGGSGANAIERGCGEDFRRRFVDPAPDTVTLRRDDVERLVAQWVDRGFHESDDGPDPTYLRVRAALGWGDDSE